MKKMHDINIEIEQNPVDFDFCCFSVNNCGHCQPWQVSLSPSRFIQCHLYTILFGLFKFYAWVP